MLSYVKLRRFYSECPYFWRIREFQKKEGDNFWVCRAFKHWSLISDFYIFLSHPISRQSIERRANFEPAQHLKFNSTFENLTKTHWKSHHEENAALNAFRCGGIHRVFSGKDLSKGQAGSSSQCLNHLKPRFDWWLWSAILPDISGIIIIHELGMPLLTRKWQSVLNIPHVSYHICYKLVVNHGPIYQIHTSDYCLNSKNIPMKYCILVKWGFIPPAWRYSLLIRVSNGEI